MELSSLGELSKPWNLLQLNHGRAIQLRIDAYLDGTVELPATFGAPAKQVPAMRLFGARLDRSSDAKYFDVISLQLMEQLRPLLDNRRTANTPMTIRARGRAPRMTYSIEIEPS
jgi:hypothetical protein